MPNGFSALRDDFTDNVIAPVWQQQVVGSATVAETVGQARCTLPSGTAGVHSAYYISTTRHNLTGDIFVWNIQTMVATGVAARVSFDLVLDGSNYLTWTQQSNTIGAYTTVAGVATALFTATWSGTTYKYLKIRESGGVIYFDSSTNGTSWTARASVANPFAVTDLYTQFGASCGNIASPGSLRLDDVNLILPALATNWHMTQIEWPLLYRFKTITISAGSGQGYIATSNDGTTWAYFSGPIGSASGGYDQLTAQSTQAAAQAMAVSMPLLDGRWDLPSMVECRYIRLHHRSTNGLAYALHEYYARRLLQSDDIEAESIRAINISAGAITADKIFVLQLSAITANIGGLNIDVGGYLWQGTGTAASPTTGLKIYNSGGIGRLATYNTGVEQVVLDTDGKLKAGAGATFLDATGANIILSSAVSATRALRFTKADGTTVVGQIGGSYSTGASHGVNVTSGPDAEGGYVDVSAYSNSGSSGDAKAYLRAQKAIPAALITLTSDGTAPTIEMSASGGIQISHTISAPASSGSAVFALDGTNTGGGMVIVNNGTGTPFGATRNFSGLIIISETAVNGTCAVFVADGGGGVVLISSSVANTWTTTATTASRTNVYLVTGAITIENKLGSSATYRVMAFRTRTA